MKKYNLAIVGVTGMVGQKFLEVLEERNLPIDKYFMFASARSAGKTISFMGKEHIVEELTPSCFDNKEIDIALFSAGGDISKTLCPHSRRKGHSGYRQQQRMEDEQRHTSSCARGKP